MFPCCTGSLQEYESLQRVCDALHDISLGWRSQGDEAEACIFGDVSGDHNYHFKLQLEGAGLFHNGTLAASARVAATGEPVPLRCRWMRCAGDAAMVIPEVTSNTYMLSADDVGSEISVEAQPLTEAIKSEATIPLGDVAAACGTAVGRIGPFNVNPSTRRSLDTALGLGSACFEVRQVRNRDNAPPLCEELLTLRVRTDGVQVSPAAAARAPAQAAGSRPERPTPEVSAEFSAEYPKVIIPPLHASRFLLLLSADRAFRMIAPSRTARDLIVLTIRSFHAMRNVLTKDVLARLMPDRPADPQAISISPQADARLDASIVLERTVCELNQLLARQELAGKVIQNVRSEIQQLEEQLLESITGFTEVIDAVQDELADGSIPSFTPTVPAELLPEQLRHTTLQNEVLRADLQRVRQRLARTQAAPEEAASPLELQQLREERARLKAELESLSSAAPPGAQAPGKADLGHAQQLKRLRQDVETLYNQKEQLRRRLQDQNREYQDMQGNLLYAKGQVDRLQARQAHAASDADGGGSAEIQRQKGIVEAARKEKISLLARLEEALREAEKDKAYHKQSLERVMNANSRLLETKDQVVLETQRLSRLYAESLNQLQAQDTSGRGLPSAAACAAGPADQRQPNPAGSGEDLEARVDELRAQLARADEVLAHRAQDNERMRSRIRRLAVV